uniref:DUF148 domain-containing protein n=1 Tax=Meloidogyne hapla TaxID=6305 RepID=A0A1I8C1E5_MELHA
MTNSNQQINIQTGENLPFVQQQQMEHRKVMPQQQQRFQHSQIQPQQGGGISLSDQQVVVSTPRQQNQMRSNDVSQIFERFKTASSSEDKETIFKDLRKTPHLFNAFLKMTAKKDEKLGGKLDQQKSNSFTDHTQLDQRNQLNQIEVSPNDVSIILKKFKTAPSSEEKEAIFKDLRKTPHLFNAFLKMTAEKK